MSLKQLVYLSFFALTMPAASDDTCVAGPGWHIRICTNKTESRGIRLSVGSGGDTASHRFLANWQRGQPTDFQYPIDLRYAGEVFIGARVTDNDRNGNVCLMYNYHKVKHLDFDKANEDEEHEKHRDDSDDCDC